MKLTKIALSVVAGLGVAAVGGSWYTGQKVEQEYQKMVEQSNASLKSLAVYGIDAQFKDVKLTRHFFSSDVSYQIEIKYSGENYVLNGRDKLFHGPFPINRLSQGKLMPVMASSEGEWQPSDNLKAQFDNKAILTSETTLNYNKQYSGEFKLNPFKSADGKVILSGVTMTSEGQYENGEFQAGLDNFNISVKNDESPALHFALEGVEYGGKMVKDTHYPALTLGDYRFKAKKLAMWDDSELVPTIQFTDVDMTSLGEVKGERVVSPNKMSAQLGFENKFGKVTLGKLNSDMTVEADSRQLNDVTLLLQNPNASQFNDGRTMLLAKPFSLKYQLQFENEKGKNALDLNWESNALNFGEAASFEQILSGFKNSYLNTTLNLASLEALATAINKLDPNTKDTAESQAKFMVNELVNQALQIGAEVDSENLKMSLVIDNGKVKWNGQELSQEELSGALFTLMLMMSMSGM